MNDHRRLTHQWIYFGGLALLAAGLPSSVFLMSVSQIILFLNWLAEGRFLAKWQRIRTNKAALLFISIYLLHLIALFYSSNTGYGISTLRTRLPVFLLTLVVATSDPLPKGLPKYLLLVFSGSITVVSLFSMHSFLAGSFLDYRELSPFISHIRLSLMVTLSVFLLLYLAKNEFNRQPVWRGCLYGAAAWHMIYLLILHSLSGILVFMSVLLVWGTKQLFALNFRYKPLLMTAGGVAVLAGLTVMLLLWRNVSQPVDIDVSQLDSHSLNGYKYTHVPDAGFSENGHPVYIYIAEGELREQWNQASPLDFDGENYRGEPLKDALYRYMSSKGLRKDAEAFATLSAKDVEHVEQGIANYQYTRWPWIITRIHQSMWEIQQYRLGADPSGHTLTQRIEFWRAAVEAIKKKPWTGWGTGDIREASQYGLEKTGSSLAFERWMKPHNQYLSFAVLFGLPGAIWILFALAYSPVLVRKFHSFPFLAFFVVLWVSMLNEDTIDTQAGLSFFVFFYNFFLFLKENKT